MQNDSAGNDVSRMMMGKKRSSGRSFFLMLVMTTAMVGVPTLADQAFAQVTSGSAAKTSFDIRPQPLAQALVQFSNSTGVQLFFNADLARGINSQGAQGSLTRAEALNHILAGSGLIYKFTNASTVSIQKPASAASASATAPSAIALDTVTVEGQRAATTEGSDSYGSSYATVFGKDGSSIKETPQSVSVVTHKRLEDQNLTSLDKAIANTTGMVVQQADSDRAGYYSRGFPIDTVMIDGVPTNIALSTTPQDLAMFDRVEVLRGPAGLLGGLGSPGGTISLAHKLPSSEFHVSNELSVGSYDYIRNQFDITGPLNDAKTVRGRLVGTLQSQDFVEDDNYRRLGQAYGIVEGDLSENTTARIGAYYQRSPARQSWTGVPVTTDYQFVDAPRSTFFGSPWNSNIYTQTGVFGEIEHEFDNGWSTKANLNYVRFQSDITADYVNGMVDPATMTAPVAANRWAQDDQQYALDWYATGPVEAFGRTHKFTFGINASHEDLGQKNFYGPADNMFYTRTLDIFDLDVPQPAFDGGIYGRHTITNEYSAYGNARISLADPLTLVLGGRMLWWDSTYKPNADENYWGEDQTTDRINSKAIPFAGLVYDLNSTYSIYGSYATIFQPQTTRNIYGDLLQPIEGEQYEAGIKASYLGGNLNTSLALFSLTQKNRAMADPSDPTGTIYFAQGKARAQGIEAEISGKMTDRWDVFAGYTYTDTRNYDDSPSTDWVGFKAIAPRHLFKLWTTYNLPFDQDRWTVGAGVFASSEFSAEDAGGQLVAKAYATTSAFASYKFNDHLTASLNVDNIFDKKYIRSLNGTSAGFYGDPRTVFLKVKTTW